MKATHHVEVNRRTHTIEQMGRSQPIAIAGEYEADCHDCKCGITSTSWEEVQDWAQKHVGIVLDQHVNYSVVARAQQDNIERLLEEKD